MTPVARGGLEDALRGEHVVAQVEREHVAEAAHAGLRREVEDAVEAREVELASARSTVRRSQPAASSRVGVLLLEREVVVVGEAVDPDDVVAGGGERLGEVRADEPGGAGDGVAHGAAA